MVNVLENPLHQFMYTVGRAKMAHLYQGIMFLARFMASGTCTETC